MKSKSLELIHALNAAAVVLQRTSRSEAEVFSACRDEIARLGFRGGLSVLDEAGEKLIVKATVQPQWMAKILADLEIRAGYKARGYSFPFAGVSVYREVIETHQAVFVPDSSSTIVQMMPEAIRSLSGVVIKAIGTPPGIYAPLKRQGQVTGVLNIMGGELTPEDVPAVEAFANHISIALENARLFDALRLSENVATKFQEKLRILHEVNFELTGIESLDELYQAVVETGLQRLRFERLALFLIEEDGKFLRGTYGTDETGHIRDEKHVREEINETKNKHLLDCLRSRTRSTHLESVALHGAGQELDKKGWNALAIVWDGINAIGMLATDNYLTQLPPQPYMEDLLSIYGNIVGHLIARIRNEQAMRESEQRYRALFEESPISIWEEDFSPVKRRIDALRAQGVKDFQSYFDSHPQEVTECAEMVRIVDVNKAALKIYRAGKKEDLLKSLRQALDMESLAGFQEELVAIANGKTVLYRECSDKTLTGEQIDVSLSWLVAPGYENDFARVIVSVVDITERKRAEIEREKLIADLEMKNAELERFVYTLSHDLKSPLVTINGFLGYLKQDAVSGNLERFHQDAQRIQSAADTMQRLLGELIELSRVGQFVYGPETVPFNDLVHKALALLPGHLESREITVRTHPNLPAVYGDKQRLVEVLQNLLDNAVKYMGGQVEPVIEIGITGYDNSNDPIFFVRDNGIGIPPEYHDHVFGIFNKLDPHTEGTGVGLSLVKRIIEVHRGRIWVESEAGKGSTFFFTLPATPPG